MGEDNMQNNPNSANPPNESRFRSRSAQIAPSDDSSRQAVRQVRTEAVTRSNRDPRPAPEPSKTVPQKRRTAPDQELTPVRTSEHRQSQAKQDGAERQSRPQPVSTSDSSAAAKDSTFGQRAIKRRQYSKPCKTRVCCKMISLNQIAYGSSVSRQGRERWFVSYHSYKWLYNKELDILFCGFYYPKRSKRMQKYKKITKFAIFFAKNFRISFIYSNFARFFDEIVN